MVNLLLFHEMALCNNIVWINVLIFLFVLLMNILFLSKYKIYYIQDKISLKKS